jgi:hypothetical protein
MQDAAQVWQVPDERAVEQFATTSRDDIHRSSVP